MAKILVVDDSKMLRDMVVYALNEGGYKDVCEAENGKEGLERAMEQKFDVVLTDINMPIMDGFDLTTSLRKNEKYDNTPILVLTTESSDEMKERGKSCGATGWIVKPFVPEELLYVIEVVLSK